MKKLATIAIASLLSFGAQADWAKDDQGYLLTSDVRGSKSTLEISTDEHGAFVPVLYVNIGSCPKAIEGKLAVNYALFNKVQTEVTIFCTEGLVSIVPTEAERARLTKDLFTKPLWIVEPSAGKKALVFNVQGIEKWDF